MIMRFKNHTIYRPQDIQAVSLVKGPISDTIVVKFSEGEIRETFSKDESIEDTLLDLSNYAILMAGYIKSKKK